jgi:hypothetical protein
VGEIVILAEITAMNEERLNRNGSASFTATQLCRRLRSSAREPIKLFTKRWR